MKTFEQLTDEQAMERLNNWLFVHIRLSRPDIEEKLKNITENFGSERVLDIAYFIQYAMRSQIDYITIFQTVSQDISVKTKSDNCFKTFAFSLHYKSKSLVDSYGIKRQNVIKRAS